MADNISALLGMGLTSQDDMNALARSLRQEQAVGDYFSGSSSPRMAQYGQNLSKRQGDAATRGGILSQALAKEKTRQEELSAKVLQDQENYKSTAQAKVDAASTLAGVNADKAELLNTNKVNAASALTKTKAAAELLKADAKVTAAEVAADLDFDDFEDYVDADGNHQQIAQKAGKVFTHDKEGNVSQTTLQGKRPYLVPKTGRSSSSNAHLYPSKWSSANERKKFEQDSEDYMVQSAAFNAFKPEYGNTISIGGNEIEGLPFVSSIENAIARNIPIISDKESQEKSKWWSDYKKYYENIERHGLFGSALTTAEQAVWKASNISENMTAEQVESSLATLNSIIKKKMDKAIGVAQAKNWPQEYIDANVQWLGDKENVLDSEVPIVPIAPGGGGWSIKEKK